MADFIPNETQQKMLEHLFDTTKDTPKKIAEEFPMASREITQEAANYRDYLELVRLGLIWSDRNGEYITNDGILATSARALAEPTYVTE